MVDDEAVVVHFPGDPALLAPRYAEAIRRFRETHPEVRPRSIFLGRGDGELVAVIVWPRAVGHEVLGRFMQGVVDSVGLPFPNLATHLDVAVDGWDELAALPAGA